MVEGYFMGYLTIKALILLGLIVTFSVFGIMTVQRQNKMSKTIMVGLVVVIILLTTNIIGIFSDKYRVDNTSEAKSVQEFREVYADLPDWQKNGFYTDGGKGFDLWFSVGIPEYEGYVTEPGEEEKDQGIVIIKGVKGIYPVTSINDSSCNYTISGVEYSATKTETGIDVLNKTTNEVISYVEYMGEDKEVE